MARKYLVPIDLTKQELQNARVQNLASAPASPVSGQIYFDTTASVLYFYDGSAWVSTKTVSTFSQGVAASRPVASTAGNNALYYATDTDLLFVSDGTNWGQVSSFGSGESTTIAMGDSAGNGSSNNYARADHSHGAPAFGTITAQTSYGASSGNGSATTPARSDHTHGTPSLTAVTPQAFTIAGTGAVGTGTAPAREDHTHAGPGFGSITAQTSFGASSGNGSATTPARSDHTHGTPAHDASAHSAIKISDLASPSTSVAFGSQKITGLADPTLAQDAATKAYVDGVATGLDVKASVRVATTANITLSGTQTIDGVAVIAGDRVLVKNQTTGSENGIYVVGASAWSRSTDADTSAEVTSGMFTFVSEGTANGHAGFVLATDDAITLGTTSLVFTQFSDAVAYTASNGVLLTGSNLTFAPSSTGGLETGAGGGAIKLQTNSGLATTSNGIAVGAGTGISVVTGTVAIDTTVVARKYSETIGDGTATSFTVTHSLATRDCIVQVYTVSDYTQVETDVTRSTTSAVTVAFSTAPTSNQYRVVVLA